MAAPIEVLVSSDASGQLWNACVWDLETGSSLTTYKGGSTSPRTLSILGQDYLMGANPTKPLLNVWSLQKRNQSQMRIVCPGRVTSLDVSPDGSYCVAGIADKIHVWQVCNGNLLAVVSRHYQNINCIKFTDDGSHFVSGGEDNLVIAWSLVRLVSISPYTQNRPEPRHVWSGHSLPVTDLHVGCGGSRARVISSSRDNTCKLWDLCSGELLCTLVFDSCITAVAMDNMELRVFAGDSNGNIHSVAMFTQPVKTERHISTDTKSHEGVTMFKGHLKQVTCLSVSMDGTRLVSGSHDASVRIWDVFSGQCVRTLAHKDVITNVFLTQTPRGVALPDSRPQLPLQHFKRHLVSTQADDTVSDKSQVFDVWLHETHQLNQYTANPASDEMKKSSSHDDHTQAKLEEEVVRLQGDLDRLQGTNQDLYQYAVHNILNTK
ncbi:WD repeat-containing protein 18-like [Haliotis cracherodii]|uniref:WD repeat-containing protein 18-like n=1 Tax=Haliotis cracherodii TaxID=6455 RepID=UPI0039E77224